MPRKKKKKYTLEVYLEPVAECEMCGHLHLQKDRKRIVLDDDSEFLAEYVCPKCSKQGYTIIGDKEFKKRKYE